MEIRTKFNCGDSVSVTNKYGNRISAIVYSIRTTTIKDGQTIYYDLEKNGEFWESYPEQLVER